MSLKRLARQGRASLSTPSVTCAALPVPLLLGTRWRAGVEEAGRCHGRQCSRHLDSLRKPPLEKEKRKHSLSSALSISLNLSHFVAHKISRRGGVFPLRCRAHRL